MKNFIIRRDEKPSDTYIPEDGEMVYSRSTNEFFIGDGINVMTKLKPFTNIVKSDSGKVFLARIDENDKPIIQHYIQKDLQNGEVYRFFTDNEDKF